MSQIEENKKPPKELIPKLSQSQKATVYHPITSCAFYNEAEACKGHGEIGHCCGMRTVFIPAGQVAPAGRSW